MKNRNRTYLLLVAVIAVWGTIGYRLFSGMNPSTPESAVVTNTDFKRIYTEKGELKTIQPDYRDPFLGKVYRKKKKQVPVKRVVKKNPIVFPPIQYIGIISGNTNSFIIQINGRQEIFRKDQTIQGVTLKKGDEKNIVIQFKGESKIVQRMQ